MMVCVCVPLTSFSVCSRLLPCRLFVFLSVSVSGVTLLERMYTRVDTHTTHKRPSDHTCTQENVLEHTHQHTQIT